MESVITRSSRWRFLHAYCYGRLMFPLAYAITTNPPMLIEACMNVTPISMDMAGITCSMSYPSSPNLDTLVVQGGPRLRMWDTRIRRTTLTTFVYNPIFVVEEFCLALDHVYDLLEFYPALEEIVVSAFSNIAFHRIWRGSKRKHLVLPNLAGLRIYAYHSVDDTEMDVGPLMDFLTTPNLEFFALMGATRKDGTMSTIS